jgi:hypothetical protein
VVEREHNYVTTVHRLSQIIGDAVVHSSLARHRSASCLKKACTSFIPPSPSLMGSFRRNESHVYVHPTAPRMHDVHCSRPSFPSSVRRCAGVPQSWSLRCVLCERRRYGRARSTRHPPTFVRPHRLAFTIPRAALHFHPRWWSMDYEYLVRKRGAHPAVGAFFDVPHGRVLGYGCLHKESDP